MELDLTRFEPFMNEALFRVLSRHPNGLLAALQVVTDHPQTGNSANFSANWNVETRTLVWKPERVGTLAWNVDDSEIGLISEHYDYDPTAHVLIGSACEGNVRTLGGTVPGLIKGSSLLLLSLRNAMISTERVR